MFYEVTGPPELPPPHHYRRLVLLPLLLLDLLFCSLLWLYAMAYQLWLYSVYLVLFLLCQATGRLDKVERPRLGRAEDADTEPEPKQLVGWGGEESGYLSDSDTDTETQI